MLGLFLAVLLALTFVGTVLAVSIAAGRLALGALLAVLTTSLGLLLLAALRLLLTALCLLLTSLCLSLLLFATSLGMLLALAVLLLLAALLLGFVALIVLCADDGCHAHHCHDHHGTEQNLFHVRFCFFVLLNKICPQR